VSPRPLKGARPFASRTVMAACGAAFKAVRVISSPGGRLSRLHGPGAPGAGWPLG